MSSLWHDAWPLFVLLFVCLGLIVGCFALIEWNQQDFANRCERAGGVLVNYDVCVSPGSQVLMVRG